MKTINKNSIIATIASGIHSSETGSDERKKE
jgi:hypothetical protein